MSATLRVKPDVACVVCLPDGRQIAMAPNQPFASDDPLVAEVCKATGTKLGDWFQADADAPAPKVRRQSVRVEDASADPGRS